MTLRTFVERYTRNLQFRRRLPSEFGNRIIWTSPDARLRYLRPGDSTFDRELLGFARNFVLLGSTVLDVGANVGESALAACHLAGSQGAVLAMEPDPFLCALLHRTIAEQGNASLPLDALCAAVSDKMALRDSIFQAEDALRTRLVVMVIRLWASTCTIQCPRFYDRYHRRKLARA